MKKKQIKNEFEKLNEGAAPEFENREQKNSELIKTYYVCADKKISVRRKHILKIAAGIAACVLIFSFVGIGFLIKKSGENESSVYCDANSYSVYIDAIPQYSNLNYNLNFNGYKITKCEYFYNPTDNSKILLNVKFSNSESKAEVFEIFYRDFNQYLFYNLFEKATTEYGNNITYFLDNDGVLYLRYYDGENLVLIRFENETLDNAAAFVNELTEKK